MRYRNIWIRELSLDQPETDFNEPPAIAALIPPSETVQTLFNGRDLDGWEGDERYWSVSRGCIRGANTDPVPSSTYLQLHSNGQPQEYHFRTLLLTANPSEQLATVRDPAR